MVNPNAITLFARLELGTSGPEVGALQEALMRADAKARLKVDRRFGWRTHLAVIAFQRTNKLKGDGIVGRYTSAALGWNWRGPKQATPRTSAPIIPSSRIRITGYDYAQNTGHPLREIYDAIVTGMDKFVDLLSDETKRSGAPKENIDTVLTSLNQEVYPGFLSRIAYMKSVTGKYAPDHMSPEIVEEYTAQRTLGFADYSLNLSEGLNWMFNYLQDMSDHLKRHGGSNAGFVERANRVNFPSLFLPLDALLRGTKTITMAVQEIRLHFMQVNAPSFRFG